MSKPSLKTATDENPQASFGLLSAEASHTSFAKKIGRIRELGVLLALVLVLALFSILEPTFWSLDTFGDIFTQSAELGVAATGVTLLMIAGEFDLSVGAVFALTGVSLALLTQKMNVSWTLALPASLLIGSFLGLINGSIALGARIPSFIATLGTMMFLRGGALAITEGWPVAMDNQPHLLGWMGANKLVGTFQISVLWWTLVVFAFMWTLQKTAFGNHVLAVGGNAKAAERLGVSPFKIKLICFVIATLLAGVAGLLQLGRMGSMSPVWGDSLALESIAAAVVGGTWLSGGIGTIWGTALGALTISAIRVGLVMVGAPTYWYSALVGLVVIIAVIVNLRIHPWLMKKLQRSRS